MDRRAAGALLALAACLATATAAPTSNHTALDLYDGSAEGCYYNFQHYGEGDRIMTNEPCLNCTCHNRMLMCYLRVCPFTKPIGQDCTVEKRADQCCPIVTCPDVPVDLLTSTSTTSPAEYGGTGVGKVDNYGCSINGKYFPEGAKVPPTPGKPCEHCYCIRNMTTCVMQECTLHVDGCTPIYHKDVCCPVRYFCDHPEDETLQLDDMTTTVRPTPGFLLTTTPTETPTTEIQTKRECIEDGQTYPDGALIKTEKPCVHCYCMKGDIVCVVQECGTPMENEGKNCTSMPPREGQCCPDTYICEGDEITTETLLEEITTLIPPESTTRRGSVVRKEPGVTYTESTTALGIEGSGEEGLLPSTLESSDLPTPKVETEDRFGVTDQISFNTITTESPAYEVKEHATTEPDKDLNTVPSETSEDDHSEQSILDRTTNKAEIMTTFSVIQETSTIGTDQKQGSEVPEITSIDEKIEVASATSSMQIEDETTQVSVTDGDKVTPLLDQSLTTPSNVINELTSKPLLTEQTTQKSDSVTEVNLTTLESEAPLLDQSKTTPLNDVSIQTSEPILLEQTTLKSELVTELKLTTLENDTSILDQFRTTPAIIISEPILTEQTTRKSDSVTEVKLTTLEKDTSEPTETITKDVFSEETVTEFTEHSSEPSIEEKTTTIHELLEVTESSATSKEKEITSTSILEETTTSILEVTESVVPIKEHTTHEEISPVESSEPSLFDENTSSGAVTESDKNRTTISSIYEDDFAISTTPKVEEGVKKSTELTTAEENKASTTENLVEEIVTTPEPSHEQNLVPDVGLEGKITTKPIPDETFAPFTEVVPQDEKQDITEANFITTLRPNDEIQPAETTTTLNPKDNEISEDILPPGRIPGEGDCLFNGVTYRNESSVPNINKCESSCKCISSIIKCDRILCSPPPEYMEDCQLVYDTSESCCPTYICEEKKETSPPQPHSQMSGTESPTLPPSVQCYGDECKLILEKQPTTIHPDLTIIPSSDDCGSEGCESKIPEKTNISGKEPEKCIGDKCNECLNGDCQLPSSQKIPTENTPQKCQGSDECREDETKVPVCEGEGCISKTPTAYEIPTPCEGSACISETPTLPEIPVPCKGDSCPEVLQGCTSDKCIASDNVPPKTSEVSEICSDGKDCTQFEEKDCVEDNCRRNKDRIKPPSQPLPSKCIGQDCPQQEPSPDEEVLLATTEQTLLKVSTFLPSSHGTLINDTTYELPNTVTDSITEKTTQSTADHKEPDSLYTVTSEGAITTHAPQVTESLKEENTVAGEQITETETHHTGHSTPSTTEVYTDKLVTANTKETEIERDRTESPSVTENQEEFTSRPVESETQLEDLSTRTPESTFSESKTEKLQTPLSEFKPTQPQELFTQAPDVEQPGVSTDSNIHDEQTEISDEILSSPSISSSQQDISELKTTPEYMEQTTIPPRSTEKVQEPQNIPSSSGDTELPEKPKEQEDTTTLSPELELTTTKLTPSVSEKGAPQEITTRTQEITTIPTEKPNTQEEMQTDLPADFVTDSLKPVKDPTGTETSIPTEVLLYDTESPLQTVKENKVTTEISEIMTKRTESPALEAQTEQIDSYPTTRQSITTETTKNPIENITLKHEVQEKEQRPEMQITESSLDLDTNPSEEPVETLEPENFTEMVSNISKPTEPTMLQESTSEKEIQTDRPMELGTELSIPVSITEQPIIDTKETDESQICENETECKKTQVPDAEMTPCHGGSCVAEKEVGTELSIPVSITEQPSIDTKETDESQMCENETECKKTQVPVADMTPCQGDSCVVEKEVGTELSIPVSITEQPSIDTTDMNESQMCDNETECKKTQVPVAEMTPCQGDSCVVEKEVGTELSIPVSITEQPSIDTTKMDESQTCENETECKKTQVPVAEMTPCQGDSCVIEREGCKSSECIQNSLPPKTTPTDICNKENGCIKPTDEECTQESCKKSEIPSSDLSGTQISDTEITTKTPGILEEELHTEITFEPHVTEKEVPTTEILSLDSDKTAKEPFSEEPEKGITELPESLITSAPLATESHKYDISKQTDATQPDESITPKYEITTKGPHELDTEHPSSYETISQQEITMAPQEQFPTEQQIEVTESLVSVEITEVKDSSTLAPELPKITERGDEVTEEPKISSPEEHDLTVKPDIGETLIPEKQEPELSQPEVTTTGYSEITSMLTQDHDGERKTERPEMSTIPDLSTREPETTMIQQSEDEVAETTEADIAEITRITEEPTEPKHEFTETTPLLVELEEHTHKMEESITSLPSEEPFTEETTNIHDTEKQLYDLSTQKPSQTESTLQYTEKLSEDNILSETLRPDFTTISDEILDKTTEPFPTKEASSEPSKSTSSDIQVSDSKFTTKSKDQDEVSTVASTFPETKQTTHIPSETEKPQPIEDDLPQTIHDTISSTAGTLETTAPEEEFMQVTTKTTTPKTDEDVATQSPSAVDNYTKPETSTDVYPSTHAAETQKPVFSDTPPTDEAPQPEEESHFPTSGSYEPEPDYPEEEFGPGTCRYGGKVYVSAQQIPRDDPCDFCFCFRSDIICLQQSCPPPIHGCHEEPIQGFCCPRYECPVSMATTLNVTTTTTTTTTTLPPHFLPHAYKGAAQRRGCQIKGHIYKVGEVVRASSGPCLHCTCGGDGQMKCDPKVCTPEPMLRQMIAAAVSAKRRR